MLNLGGLSAAYPGYQASENLQATTETNQAAAKEAALKLLGQHVLGRALTGAQPDQGPQAPAPGQPSVPSASQGGDPAGPGAIPNPMQQAPPAPPQGAPGMTPGPGVSSAPPPVPASDDELWTIKGMTARILATSPQVRNHPEVLMAALERAAPRFDAQSKEDLAELRTNFQKQLAAQRTESAAARLEEAKRWHDRTSDDRRYGVDTRAGTAATAEEGRNTRSTATEEGKSTRSDARLERTDRRLDQADEREARISKFAASREGQALEKLDLARRSLEQRIESAKTREDRERLALELRTNHQKATEILQANSVMSSLKPLERKSLLQERAAQVEDAITRLRGKSSQPTTTAPAAINPDAPPVSMLKEGQPQAFKNKQTGETQTWTLENGQPKQVK